MTANDKSRSTQLRPTDDPDSEAWLRARDQAADLKSLLDGTEFSQKQAEELAGKWGVSARTVWRRVKSFRRDGGMRAFLIRARGSAPGVGRLNGAVETIVGDVARTWWRATENATISEILPDIRRECAARSLPRPSRATVARRLATLKKDPSNFSRVVAAKLRDRTRLSRGSYVVASALGVVQVDHTIADVFIVDPSSRACIGRPTLTVAVDVATRCIAGICLSLEAPSSLQLALCLENAVSPKEPWLANLGISIEWPVYGIPDTLHVDNGREFHSAAFRRGCDLNGIDTIYRPPATPRFGGHVERLIGTLMRRVRLLPGNSYSDFLHARPDRAEKSVTLTLNDLGSFLLEDINRYHRSRHRALGVPPLSAWEQHWTSKPIGPRVPKDIHRFRLEFLPLQRRVIGREGIELFGLKYSNEALSAEVDIGRQRVVRYDPRNLSCVFLERPNDTPLAVPLRDSRTPAISLWELKAIKRGLIPVDLQDADAVLRAVATEEEGASSTLLMKNRRKVRRESWRTVALLNELPLPNTSLQTTLVSNDLESLPWEVLE